MSDRAPGLLYRAAMALAPARFRRRYAADMYEVFRRTLEAGPGGWRRWAIRGWFVVDVVGTIASAWGGEMRGMGGWGTPFEAVLADAKVAVRGLRRRPGVSAALVATFALGVGVNAAVFQVFDALMLSPLPFPRSERLVAVWHTLPGRDKAKMGPATYLDFRERSSALESVALLDAQSVALTGSGDPVQIPGARVSWNFFDVLGLPLPLGTGFEPEDEAPGAGGVVVLGHGLWQRRFGGDPGVVGRTVTLGGVPTQVVGVAPAGFALELDGDPELWTVMTFGERERGLRGTFHHVVARLRPGASVREAEAELDAIFEDVIASGQAASSQGWGVRVVSLKEELVGPVGATLRVLMAAGVLVLLIAVANSAALTLARTATRSGETAVRVALGASRSRLVGQRMVEGLVVAFVGGAVGVVLAVVVTRALLAAAPDSLPRLHEVAVDGRVLGFATAVTVLAGLVSGLAPVFAHSDADTARRLRSGGRTGTSRGLSRSMAALVAGQSALVLVLLVGAGLLIKSFYHLSTVDPGFDSGPALVVGLDLPASRYPDFEAVDAFARALEREIAARPGVAGVGVTTHVPTRGGFQLFYEAEDHPLADPSERKLARFEAVGPGYLELLGARLERGRLLSPADRAEAPPVMVVNRTMADLLWPGRDPIGKEITLGRSAFEIVGVVADVRHQSLTADPEPQFYLPDGQMGFRWSTRDVLIRPAGDGIDLLPAAVRSALRSLDPELPTAYMGSMERVMGEAVADSRFRVRLLALLASVALALGATGVYGLVSFAAGRRLREMAVRRSLGATAGHVGRRIVTTGLTPVAVGAVPGLALAASLSPRLGGLLFRVDPHDTVVFGGTALFLLLIGLLAGAPAVGRVLRVRPVESLTGE